MSFTGNPDAVHSALEGNAQGYEATLGDTSGKEKRASKSWFWSSSSSKDKSQEEEGGVIKLGKMPEQVEREVRHSFPFLFLSFSLFPFPYFPFFRFFPSVLSLSRISSHPSCDFHALPVRANVF